MGVDLGGEALVEGDGRAVLLNHSRAGQDVAGSQVRAPEDVGRDEALRVGNHRQRVLRTAECGLRTGVRGPHCAAEADGPGAGAGSGGIAVAGRKLRQVRSADRAYAGDSEVDPLHLLAGIATEVVAVQGAVRIVESVGNRRVERRVGQVGHRDPHLEGLAVVAEVGGPDQPSLVRGEALPG